MTRKISRSSQNGFLALDAIVGRDDGKIPRKSRELIALAVACTTQCPYCLDVHARAAKKAGASREEVTEAALLATTHGALALKLFDKALKREGPRLCLPADQCRRSTISHTPIRPIAMNPRAEPNICKRCCITLR